MPALSQWEICRSRVNQQHQHGRCQKQTRWRRAATAARDFFRLIVLHQVIGNSESNFCFRMGCLHTTIPVQNVGQPHAQAQKRSKGKQIRRRNNLGFRRWNVFKLRDNWQIHRTTSRSHDGQKKNFIKIKIKNWVKVEKDWVSRQLQKNGTRGRGRASKKLKNPWLIQQRLRSPH